MVEVTGIQSCDNAKAGFSKLQWGGFTFLALRIGERRFEHVAVSPSRVWFHQFRANISFPENEQSNAESCSLNKEHMKGYSV